MNRQIIEEASEWFVQLSEGDADIATRQRFHDWIARSPDHIQAYLKILPVWEDAAKLDTHANDRQALVAWARTGTNVVPFGLPASDGAEVSARDPSNPYTGAAPQYKLRRIYRYAFAATVAIAASAAFALFVINKAIYATGVGEQQVVTLDDGSSVELNSRSKMKIQFTDQERSIELLYGQALFKVAKDATRPFIVRSGETSVRAVGTQFDVYKKKMGTVVTVLEGKVAVASGPSPTSGRGDGVRTLSVGGEGKGEERADAVTLTAGQQLTVTPSAAPKPATTNVAAATAWTQQQLVFFRTPLPEVAEEFNRYNKRQLVIRDDGLKTFHVSGTFSSTDPNLLIRFLHDQSGLDVEETGNEVSVSAR